MRDTDVAYIAGLFDGEGSVDFKRRKEKRGKYTTNAMQITMRIEMTILCGLFDMALCSC